MTSKLASLHDAIANLIPDGSSVAMGLQLEQMIPFAAGHEIMRQRKRDLTLIGPISDVLFDQLIGGGCVREVIAAWVGNVMMGSAYNFRREVESGRVKVTNLTNFSVALALQAAAMGVPFLPTRSILGTDIAKENPFFKKIGDPFKEQETPAERELRTENRERFLAVRALAPDVTIVHVQRADAEGNAHCWGNLGVMVEAVRAAKKVIVIAEEVVSPEVIASDPNRTVIPGFLVSAVVECKWGTHPSPVQGYYGRDHAYCLQYHEQTKTAEDFAKWAERWVYSRSDRQDYCSLLGACRMESLETKKHAFAAPTDYGY